MKIPNWIALTVLAVSPAAMADYFQSRLILAFEPPQGASECVYFMAQNVSLGRLAFPKSDVNFKEVYAMLLAARLSGATISIVTDGSSVCGYPRATKVLLE